MRIVLRTPRPLFRPKNLTFIIDVPRTERERGPTNLVFLYLKSTSYSIGPISYSVLFTGSAFQKVINLLQALHPQTFIRIRAYGEPPNSFETTSDFRQGCPTSSFLFKFFIDKAMQNFQVFGMSASSFQMKKTCVTKIRRTTFCAPSNIHNMNNMH